MSMRDYRSFAFAMKLTVLWIRARLPSNQTMKKAQRAASYDRLGQAPHLIPSVSYPRLNHLFLSARRAIHLIQVSCGGCGRRWPCNVGGKTMQEVIQPREGERALLIMWRVRFRLKFVWSCQIIQPVSIFYLALLFYFILFCRFNAK